MLFVVLTKQSFIATHKGRWQKYAKSSPYLASSGIFSILITKNARHAGSPHDGAQLHTNFECWTSEMTDMMQEFGKFVQKTDLIARSLGHENFVFFSTVVWLTVAVVVNEKGKVFLSCHYYIKIVLIWRILPTIVRTYVWTKSWN